MTRSEEGGSDKGRILVVDDEEAVGRLLQGWLINEGYQVERATGFDQVCGLMGRETFDLVTLDIMMPEVDGLQVLAWLQQHHPDVGVVMATAMGDLDTVLSAMRSGASNYFLKPFNLELVSEEIARAMERQRLIAENRAYQEELEQKVADQTQELQQAYARLQRQVKELEGRDRLVRCQMSGTTLAQANEEILQVVKQALEVPQAILYRPSPTVDRLEAVASLADEPIPQGAAEATGPSAVVTAEQTALVAQVFRETQPQYGDGGQAAVPLVYQGEVLGVLWVVGLPEAEREEAGNTLWRLGQEAALVLWSARVAEDLASGQMEIDQLLGLDQGSP